MSRDLLVAIRYGFPIATGSAGYTLLVELRELHSMHLLYGIFSHQGIYTN